MIKSVLSVIAGYVAWTVVFLGGSSVIASLRSDTMNDMGFSTNTATLLLYLVLSGIASLLSGLVTASIAPTNKPRHVLVLAGLLLATGIPVQLASWSQLPVWYNILFLALLAPLTVVGGRMARP